MDLRNAMPDPQSTFEQRVLLERAQLQDRLFKLRDFVGGRKFDELADAERNRLTRQLAAMSDYFEVLTERLDCAFQ